MASRGRPSIFGRLDEEDDTEQSKLPWPPSPPSPSPPMQRRSMQRSYSCNLRGSLCFGKPAMEAALPAENSPPLTAEEGHGDGDDGSVASRLLGAIGKSISSPSLTSCCKEVARETPYQKSLMLSKMKLHHCTEELGSESCTSSYNPIPPPPPPPPSPSPSPSSLFSVGDDPNPNFSVGDDPNPIPSPNPSPRPTLLTRRSFLTLVNGHPAIARDQPPVAASTKLANFPPPLDSLPPSPGSSSSSSANVHDEGEDGEDDGLFWVTLRSCKQDGRFVLKEAKVPIPSPCLRASRTGSRLTLRLNAPLAPSATPSSQAMAIDDPQAPIDDPQPPCPIQSSPNEPLSSPQPHCPTQLSSTSPQLSSSGPLTSPQPHCPTQLSSTGPQLSSYGPLTSPQLRPNDSLMSPQPSPKCHLISPPTHYPTDLSLNNSLLSPSPPQLNSNDTLASPLPAQLNSRAPLMSQQTTQFRSQPLLSPNLIMQQSSQNDQLPSPQLTMQQSSPNDPSMYSQPTPPLRPIAPSMSAITSIEDVQVDGSSSDWEGTALHRDVMRAAAISPAKLEVINMFTPAPEAKVVESFLPERSRKTHGGEECSDGHENPIRTAKGAVDNAENLLRATKGALVNHALGAHEKGGKGISGANHASSCKVAEENLDRSHENGHTHGFGDDHPLSVIRDPNHALRCVQPIFSISKGPMHHHHNHHHHHQHRQHYTKRLDWLHPRHRKDQLECRNELRKATMKMRCVATTS